MDRQKRPRSVDPVETENDGDRLNVFAAKALWTAPFLSDAEGNRLNCHAPRVAMLAKAFADRYAEDESDTLFLAGLFHDVAARGAHVHPVRMTSLPEQIKDPWMRAHALRGSQIARHSRGLKKAAPVILEHHEWWDGSGYPMGKRGMEIIPAAQIMRVVDTFDALVLASGDIERSLADLERRGEREIDPDTIPLFVLAFEEERADTWYEASHDVVRRTVAELARITPFKRDRIDALLTVIGEIVDTALPIPIGHSRRVLDLSRRIARVLGMPPESVAGVIEAALMHEMANTGYHSFDDESPGVSLDDFLRIGIPEVAEAISPQDDIGSVVATVCAFDLETARRARMEDPQRIALEILAETAGMSVAVLDALRTVIEETRGEFLAQSA